MTDPRRASGRSRRALLGSLGAAGGVGLLAAGSIGAGGTPSRKVEGSVEFWTNSGLAYKDKIGAQLANEFMQKNPGVKIIWTDMTPDPTKLVAATVAGSPPDIAYADRYTTKSLASAGRRVSLLRGLSRIPSRNRS